MNQQGLAKRGRVAPEVTNPGAIRQHDHSRRAGAVVLGHQRPPERGLDAEHLEVVPRDDLAERHPRLIAPLDRRDRRAVGKHVGEDRILLPEVEEIGIGAGRVGIAVPAARVDVDESIRLLHRERPEECRIDDREEGRIEPDPDGERRDRHDGEGGAVQEPPEGVADVGAEVLKHVW